MDVVTGQGGRRILGGLFVKRVLAVSALVVGSAAGLLVTSAPANASGACLTTSITVNGTPAPTNGTNCTPALPALPSLP